MANLGYGTSAPRRQFAGFGGNDEYAGSSGSSGGTPVVVDPPAPSVPAPAHGVANLGFGPNETAGLESGRYTRPSITDTISSVYGPVIRAGAGMARNIGDRLKSLNPINGSSTGTSLIDSVAKGPFFSRQHAQEWENSMKKPEERYKELINQEQPATVEMVDLGRKPGREYVEQPFVPKFNNASSGDDPSAPIQPVASPFVAAGEPQQAAGIGNVGPAFNTGGVVAGVAPMPITSESRNGGEETDAEIAEFNKRNAPVKEAPQEPAKKEGLLDGLKTNLETGAKAPAGPSPLTRDKLLKMAGENIGANEQAARDRSNADSRRREMRTEWTQANSQAQSGNLSQREQGLRKLADLEREGLSRGFLNQDTGAQAAYKKFTTNPYNVQEINRLRTEEGLQARAEAEAAKQAQEAEAVAKKENLEKEKFDFQKQEAAAAKEERIQARVDKLNEKFQERTEKLADIKDQREYDIKRDEIQSEQRIAEFASKFSKITERGDRDQKAMLTERMYNEVQQQAANAVSKSLEEARKYTGIFGKAKAWLDGKDKDQEISKIVGSYERHLNDQQKRFDEIGKIYNVKIPQVNFDRSRIEEAIKRRGPENSDDLIATFEDLAKAGEFGIKYLTPQGRLGAALGMGGQAMQPQQAVPFLPQYGMPPQNYMGLLNQ